MIAGVSVIICCYNSASRIGATLDYLSRQKLDNLQAEIVLVDNNCSDDTVATAKDCWQQNGKPFPLRIIAETQAGQTFARRKGIKSSAYSTTVFCDDDNWLSPDYLRIAVEILTKNPHVGAVGGVGTAISSEDLPEDFKNYGGMYATGKQAGHSGIVTQKGRLYGAGLIARKELLEKVFNADLPFVSTGRKGNQLSSGDDEEICCRTILLGYDLYYDERLMFQHSIPLERLTSDYREKLKQGFVPAFKVFRKYKLLIDLQAMSAKRKALLKYRYLLKLIKDFTFRNHSQISLTKSSLFFLSDGKMFFDEECASILQFHNNYCNK